MLILSRSAKLYTQIESPSLAIDSNQRYIYKTAHNRSY